MIPIWKESCYASCPYCQIEKQFIKILRNGERLFQTDLDVETLKSSVGHNHWQQFLTGSSHRLHCFDLPQAMPEGISGI